MTSSSGSYTVEARPSKVRTMAAGYKSNIEDVPPPLRQSTFYPESPTVGFGVQTERTKPDLPHRSRPAAAARPSASAAMEGNVYLQREQGYAQSASSQTSGASNVSRRLLAQAELARREVELQEARVRQARLEAELAAARSEKGSVAGSAIDVGEGLLEPANAAPPRTGSARQRRRTDGRVWPQPR